MAASAAVIPFPVAKQRSPDPLPARSVAKLKKQFTSSVGAKWAENAESAESERYFHGKQWSAADLKTLADRRQPPVTFNRIKRKINTICGIIERLRQDPKAFPRNPQRQAEDGAEICTKALLYALGWDWTQKSTFAARRCCVRGLSGVEMVLVQGDQGDPEIDWDVVDQRDFFYDPSSIKHDFSDARFLGTTRWVDIDVAIEQWPDAEEELQNTVDRTPTTDLDRGDTRNAQLYWGDRDRKRVRIVDHWYALGSRWHYCIYAGETLLEHGQTFLKDERGRDVHKYEMFSYEVDEDGDRYGANRDLKSPQDEVNQRRSKALHTMMSRRVIADDGAVDDVELARREYARADGWVIKNPGKEIVPDDAQQRAVVEGNLNLLTEAKSEIDTYGPNPALVGIDVNPDSGRGVQLLQAAGIAELGSFVMSLKNWKLRVYRKTWNAIQQTWTAPRWVRVTDDENLAQFIEVNGWQQDPQTGLVTVLNQLSALDVDIVLEEGPDTTTSMADTFDTLVALGKGGAQIPPEMFIELAPIASSVKQRILQQIAAAQQPKPMDQMAMQLQLQQLQAQIGMLQSQALLNQAKAGQAQADGQAKLVEAQRGPSQQVDTPADMAKAGLDMAKAQEIHHKIAVGAHVPQAQEPPPPPPGLFDLNMAKTREAHARADAAQAQAETARQTGWSTLDTSRADQLVKLATADKLAAETRTIDEAPPGMLVKPPPRPPSVPSAGKR